MRDHQGRFLHRGDDVGHREGLARTGHAQKRLVAVTGFDPGHQFVDRLRLVAGRFEIGYEGEHGGVNG
jgi:hypothetical protein